VAKYKYLPFGVAAIAVGDAGVFAVDFATPLTLPAATANVPMVAFAELAT
jgi:hypothetical protein